MPRAAPISLPIALDRAHGLQEQLTASLRASIERGALQPGARLPSIRELTDSLRISRTTVVLALQKLIDEELLITRLRSGIFVARAAPPPLAVRLGPASSSIRLSRRGEALSESAVPFAGWRPRAFRLSRPALELFPLREWNRLLARRAARTTLSQLDYGFESSELKAAVAALVSATRGIRVEASQVLLFSGSQRALGFAATALLSPGDRAWVEDPGYPGARQALRAAGAQVVNRPLDAEGISLRASTHKPRLIYVTPSNQFPLGGAMSLARRRALLAFAAASSACIVEDDYDVEYSVRGSQLPSLAALDDRAQVLHIGSFSRTTVPAHRIGYLIAPAGLAPALNRARTALEDPLPSILQLTLADFIAGGHFARHLRRMRKVYAERREALIKATAKSRTLRLRGEPDGLHAVVELPRGCDDAKISARAFAQGIEAAPLSSYCASVTLAPALVLGYGTASLEEIRDGVRRLSALVE